MLNHTSLRKTLGVLAFAAILLAETLPASAQQVVNNQIFAFGVPPIPGPPSSDMYQTMLIFGLPPTDAPNTHTTITGLGWSYAQDDVVNPALSVPPKPHPGIKFPQMDQPYTETIQVTGPPAATYTNIIWSPNIGDFMQESTKSWISLAFANDYPAGTSFPYSIGIRLHGSSAMTQVGTITSGTTFNLNFYNLPPNTTYDWCIVQGATIDVNDSYTANFLNTHHVATTSI